jgi:hypothetical protein
MRGINSAVNEAYIYNSSCPSYFPCINVLYQKTQSTESHLVMGTLTVHLYKYTAYNLSAPPPPSSGATVILVPRPPHCCNFEIARRHTTLGRTPLNEESARRQDLYLRTHNICKRETSMTRRDSNPQSQQASGRRLTP